MSLIPVWNVLPISSDWMRWNLFLALIPAVLSVGLFRWANQRSLLWWVLAIVFLAFLPNAPYILTDVIHLVEEIQHTESLLINTLIIIPKYTLFILLGFGFYALALVNLGLYLRRQEVSLWVMPTELLLHGLSAVGVQLGRFDRFNSWDLVTHPMQVVIHTLQSLADARSLLFIAAGTVVIAALYWVFKEIILALMLRYQTQSSEASKMEKDQKTAFDISA